MGRLPRVQPPGRWASGTVRKRPRSGPQRREVARILARSSWLRRSGFMEELSIVREEAS